MIENYSTICNHNRLTRLDDNFVRCLKCGLSMVNQKNILTNKNSRDFVKENGSFIKNFDRNFNNVIEEIDELAKRPIYEYYIDRNCLNLIIVNRSSYLNSNPLRFEVIINGKKTYLDNTQFKKVLTDINAVRIDKYQTEKIFNIKI